MKVTALLENNALSSQYDSKHGLSIHIKTEKHNMLFDVGPNDLFIKNAIKLNIDISEVDIVVISHGHKDHGGGLKEFLKVNDKAKIYIHKNAFDKYYTNVLGLFKYYIGLDSKLRESDRIILVDDIYKIDDELIIFNKINSNKMLPTSNKRLYVKEEKLFIRDNFNHEQNLIITSNNKSYLFAGCAHRGIVNILEQAEDITKKNIDFAIGGFHLYNPVHSKCVNVELINNIGKYLSGKKSIYYTCHCTGEKAYEQLKGILHDQINYLCSGQAISI
ncbi:MULTISPECIES: MBL fold metallo-hydrolase [unclassified Clostridium]|uniref:MBL fold metallo-hydrolase n=1 Tax=unclassified Clostridium TaxID=2614128 RepID=UPI0025C0A8E5|nr:MULTISPECIES: MBL fold metallo-hydrolase [unclassified Clostridium]